MALGSKELKRASRFYSRFIIQNPTFGSEIWTFFRIKLAASGTFLDTSHIAWHLRNEFYDAQSIPRLKILNFKFCNHDHDMSVSQSRWLTLCRQWLTLCRQWLTLFIRCNVMVVDHVSSTNNFVHHMQHKFTCIAETHCTMSCNRCVPIVWSKAIVVST